MGQQQIQLVGQALMLMSQLDPGNQVFLVGTTNHIDRIDPCDGDWCTGCEPVFLVPIPPFDDKLLPRSHPRTQRRQLVFRDRKDDADRLNA